MLEETKIVHRKISELKPNPHNARNLEKDYSENDLSMKELMKDISIRGILTPLKIFKDGTILFGNRRFHAAKYLGIKTLPCVVESSDVSEVEQLMQQVSENMIRKYPSSLERGRALFKLIDSGTTTLSEIKNQTGASDIDQCIREYKNYVATKEKVGVERMDKLMGNLKQRPDYGTIAKTVFKRTEIPEETKATLLEVACENKATSHAVENVTQQIQKVAGTGKLVSEEGIKHMMSKAMETDRHQIITRNEDWDYFKGEFDKLKTTNLDGVPATVRHLYTEVIRFARSEIEAKGGYFKAIMKAEKE